MDQPDMNMPPAPEVVAAPAQPKKKMSGWLIALIVIVVICCCLVVLGIIIFAVIANGDWSNMNLDQFQYILPVMNALA
jgi:hypothetical protein